MPKRNCRPLSVTNVRCESLTINPKYLYDKIVIRFVNRGSRFLELMINSLNVDADDEDPTVSRIGLAKYSDFASAQFQLNTYSRRADLLQAIYVRYTGGTTNTSDAIRYGRRHDCFDETNSPAE